MKILLSLLSFLAIINAQEYKISVFGIDACVVNQTFKTKTKITFSTNNIGIPGMIWPAKNFYSTEFDSLNFNLISWSKKINQGSFKQKLSANYIDSVGAIIYNNKNIVSVSKKTKNIFSLLAMAQSKESSYLDTRWFNFENEGAIGRARFVWADSVTIEYNDIKELCDHYRLDIEITKESKLNEKSDYFLGEILAPGMVKQIWVSRNKPKRIIKATFKTLGIPLVAIIYE